MKYACPICGVWVNPKTDNCIKYRTKYERHYTIAHKNCYDKLLKRMGAYEKRIDTSKE